jgi:hypothetical protein
MPHPRFSGEEVEQRSQERYEQGIRARVETDDNIGKILVIDIETGDYERDDTMLAASRRALAEQPDAALWALRIGYDAVYSFGWRREPAKQGSPKASSIAALRCRWFYRA